MPTHSRVIIITNEMLLKHVRDSYAASILEHLALVTIGCTHMPIILITPRPIISCELFGEGMSIRFQLNGYYQYILSSPSVFNPSNAEDSFVHSTRMPNPLKNI